MDNKLKSKTRLTFIQVIFQHISTNDNIDEIFLDYNMNYKNTFVENFNNKKKIKFEFNSNYLKNLIMFYNKYISSVDYLIKINKH